MKSISVHAAVNAPVERVWECWNEPEHIVKWAFASDDWEAPAAQNDLRVGGRFVTTMAAKDGSAKFDFEGVYTLVEPNARIEYTMSDGRKVTVVFTQESEGKTRVEETFDTEDTHTEEQQRAGWQAILDNFKKYAEQGSA